MAAPGEAADWRLVVAYDAARATGVLDALPGTIDAIASAQDLRPAAVRAVVDLLVAGGVLARGVDGSLCLAPGAPDADAAVQLAQQASAIRRWSHNLEARLRGEDIQENRPFRLTQWLASMAVHAAATADRIVELTLGALLRNDARGLRVADLGGGHGRYAAAFAAVGAYAVLQDRADVIEAVRHERWLEGTGVELVAGDLHDGLPDGPFDVVLAIGLLHTMPSERAASLVRRAAALLRPGGVLVVRTTLRDEGPSSSVFAVQMLVAGMGGDAHRRGDLDGWFDAAGLDAAVSTAVGASTVLIARRPSSTPT